MASARRATAVTVGSAGCRQSRCRRPSGLSGRPGWLAGTDYDADVRAVLRQSVRPAWPGVYALACLATGRSENDCWPRSSAAPATAVSRTADCSRAAVTSRPRRSRGPAGRADALAWQAALPGGRPDRARRHRRARLAGCHVLCAAAPPDQPAPQAAAGRGAAGGESSRVAASLAPASGRRAPLCVRHLLGLTALTAGRSGDGRARRISGPADRRAGRGVQQEHLGAPPRTQGTGDDPRGGGRGRVPGRPGVFCGCPPGNLTSELLRVRHARSGGPARRRRSRGAGCTLRRAPRGRARRISGGRSRYPRPGRR